MLDDLGVCPPGLRSDWLLGMAVDLEAFWDDGLGRLGLEALGLRGLKGFTIGLPK
jgi:hypothetical protein